MKEFTHLIYYRLDVVRLSYMRAKFYLAGDTGFEPINMGSKPIVLPLD